MNTLSIINKISAGTSLNKKTCEKIFNQIFSEIIEMLIRKERVVIEGFGLLLVERRKMQTVIDYSKKVVLLLPPKDKIVFLFNDEESKNTGTIKNKMKFSSKNIISTVSQKTSINDISVYEMYYSIFEIIGDALTDGKNVNISEFGKFKQAASGKIGFSPAKKFSDKVNSDFNNLKTVTVRNLVTSDSEKRYFPFEDEEEIETDEDEDTFELDMPEKETVEIKSVTEKLPDFEELFKDTENTDEITEAIVEEEPLEITEVSGDLTGHTDEKLNREKDEFIQELQEALEKEKIEEKIPEIKEPEFPGSVLLEEIEKAEKISKEQTEISEPVIAASISDNKPEIPVPDMDELVSIKDELEPDDGVIKLDNIHSVFRKESGLKEDDEEYFDNNIPEIIAEPEKLPESEDILTDENRIKKEFEEKVKFYLKQTEDERREYEQELEKHKKTTPDYTDKKKDIVIHPPHPKKTSFDDIFESKEPPEKTKPEIKSEIKFLDKEEFLEKEITSDEIQSHLPPVILDDEEEEDFKKYFSRKDEQKIDAIESDAAKIKNFKSEISPIIVQPPRKEEAITTIPDDDDNLSISSIYDKLRDSFSGLRDDLPETEEQEKESEEETEDIKLPSTTETENNIILTEEKKKDKIFPDDNELKLPEKNLFADIDNSVPVEKTSELPFKPVNETLSPEGAGETLGDIKDFLEKYSTKDKILSDFEGSEKKPVPFRKIDDIELPESMDDYFEEIKKDKLKKFPGKEEE